MLCIAALFVRYERGKKSLCVTLTVNEWKEKNGVSNLLMVCILSANVQCSPKLKQIIYNIYPAYLTAFFPSAATTVATDVVER